VTRLLALAHRWDDLLERGEVQDQATIARLMGITEARVTQIMNLRVLAPSIQDAVLHGPVSPAWTEKQLRNALKSPIWSCQEALLFSPDR
jgi:hypothetical protein